MQYILFAFVTMSYWSAMIRWYCISYLHSFFMIRYIIFVFVPLSHSLVPFNAVQYRRYCINNCRNWGRISIRCWIHKRYPIPCPNGWAMGFLLLIFFRKFTVLWQHCTVLMTQYIAFLQYSFNWYNIYYLHFTTELLMIQSICIPYQLLMMQYVIFAFGALSP